MRIIVRISQGLSLPRFQGQCFESCFYTNPLFFTYELENNLDGNSKILLA